MSKPNYATTMPANIPSGQAKMTTIAAFYVAQHQNTDQPSLASHLDNGVPPNLKNGDDTLLTTAAYYGNAPAVELLLERGADPDLQDGNWRSPLAVAMLGKHYDIARTLFEAGADPQLGEPTALEIAGQLESSEMYDLFESKK